jgi:hypothetical protein
VLTRGPHTRRPGAWWGRCRRHLEGTAPQPTPAKTKGGKAERAAAGAVEPPLPPHLVYQRLQPLARVARARAHEAVLRRCRAGRATGRALGARGAVAQLLSKLRGRCQVPGTGCEVHMGGWRLGRSGFRRGGAARSARPRRQAARPAAAAPKTAASSGARPIARPRPPPRPAPPRRPTPPAARRPVGASLLAVRLGALLPAPHQRRGQLCDGVLRRLLFLLVHHDGRRHLEAQHARADLGAPGGV